MSGCIALSVMVVRSERIFLPARWGGVGWCAVSCGVGIPFSSSSSLFGDPALAREIPLKNTPKSCTHGFWCGIMFI